MAPKQSSATAKQKSSKAPKSPRPRISADSCDAGMSFAECELAVVRQAIDESVQAQKQSVITPDLRRMISIVEDFMRRKKVVCYGGTAINNILPREAQFYDRETEVPDYDFFTDSPLEDAKELADIFFKEGFVDTEAKSGVHYGTFKVFVNYTPMADLTALHPALLKRIRADAVDVDGVLYCDAQYLRMNMHLELSRPAGDVSRWEKVASRLMLLDYHHPMPEPSGCDAKAGEGVSDALRAVARDDAVGRGAVFFGGYAASLYAKHMSKSHREAAQNVGSMDVLSLEPAEHAKELRAKLEAAGAKSVTVTHHEEFDEIVPEYCEVRVGGKSLIYIFKPIACHNYNNIEIEGRTVRVATMDTMMNFYLAFYYTQAPSAFRARILCMAKFLFDVSKQHIASTGLLKRFTAQCYGTQLTLRDMRARKTAQRKALSRDSPEFEKWFLNYNPGDPSGAKARAPGAPSPRSAKRARHAAIRQARRSMRPARISQNARSAKRHSATRSARHTRSRSHSGSAYFY